MIDVEEFAERLTDCYQRLWLIAAAVTGDRAEADDIVQEAAMIGLEKRADFAPGTNFAAWMAQIVRLTALNHRKKADRRKLNLADPIRIDRSVSATPGSAEGSGSPLTNDGRLTDTQIDFDDELLGALREINDVARTCLLLRVVRQLSYDDIADALQIPAGTAMSHVHRAKQSIRQQLRGRGNQSSQVAHSNGKQNGPP